MVADFESYKRDRSESLEQFLLPNSIDAEEAVLGGVLIDAQAMDRISGIVKPEYFYSTEHQMIFQAAFDIYCEERPIDLISVSQKLSERGSLEKIGGTAKIAQLVEMSIGAVNVDFHAELIAEKYKRRTLIQVLQDLQRSAFKPSVKWDDLLSQAEERIFALSDASHQKGLRPVSEFLIDEMERIDRFMKGEGGETGLATGFYDFDAFTQGLKRKKLYIVAGRPGMAKSSLAAAFARNIAGDGHPVAVFSLEMDGGEIVRRLLSSDSSIDSMQIESGDLTAREWESLGYSFRKISDIPLYIDESEDVTPSNVLSQSRLLKSRLGGLGAIVIDYLHLMLDSDDDDEVKNLGRITRACKKMSRALDVPVVLLSQLNRGVEAQGNKRPSLASLRGSGSIEQDADMVIFLYRDEYYDPDTEDKGIAEVIISKNRGGKTGVVKLLFEPQFTRFRNMHDRNRPSVPPATPRHTQPQAKSPIPVEPTIVQSDSTPSFVEEVEEEDWEDEPLEPQVEQWRESRGNRLNLGGQYVISLDRFDKSEQKDMRKTPDFDKKSGVGKVVTITGWKDDDRLSIWYAVTVDDSGEVRTIPPSFLMEVEA